jgi:hypothetical protein
MLYGCSNDVLVLGEHMAVRRKFVVLIVREEWPTKERIDDAKDGVVVGFGAAAGEDNFLGAGTDQSGDLLASSFDGSAGALARSMDGSGVGKFGGEIGKHGVEHGWLDGGGGIEIEVNAVHKATHRILPAGGIVRSGFSAPRRIFSAKSAESLEKERVEFFLGARKCKKVQKSAEECERKGDRKLQNGNFGYTPGSFRKRGKQRG